MINFDDTLIRVAELMALAARTAPKAKGEDNLKIKIVSGSELENFADDMLKTGEKASRIATFQRDADCVRKAACLLLIGTRSTPLGLDCGFCGFNSCKEAAKAGATCAYNSGDLGIAIGSAVSTAAELKADNRVLYTAGLTAKENGILGSNIMMALGIPLSGSGKNPFFDR
ncbi:MAG: ferredoxin [Elusimicrobia bacterium]|nr:ferredoxin [Elusimicrobiota bacterium]